jgi:hypothetical protein
MQIRTCSARTAQGEPTSGEVSTCSQSQFGEDRYLGKGWTAQAMAAVVLSVVVRSVPVMTAVNGTLVARPPRTTWVPAMPVDAGPDRRVRTGFGDPRFARKPLGRLQDASGGLTTDTSASVLNDRGWRL